VLCHDWKYDSPAAATNEGGTDSRASFVSPDFATQFCVNSFICGSSHVTRHEEFDWENSSSKWLIERGHVTILSERTANRVMQAASARSLCHILRIQQSGVVFVSFFDHFVREMVIHIVVIIV
jgi:hypothetical protein